MRLFSFWMLSLSLRSSSFLRTSSFLRLSLYVFFFFDFEFRDGGMRPIFLQLTVIHPIASTTNMATKSGTGPIIFVFSISWYCWYGCNEKPVSVMFCSGHSYLRSNSLLITPRYLSTSQGGGLVREAGKWGIGGLWGAPARKTVVWLANEASLRGRFPSRGTSQA